MEKSDWLALFQIAANEELVLSGAFHSRVAFYAGLLSALLGVLATGLFYANSLTHYFLVGVGSVVLIFNSLLARNATSDAYAGWLKQLTVRAKVEQRLGLTRVLGEDHPDDYWPEEPVIFPEHICERGKSNSSKDFVKKKERLGQAKYSDMMFFCYAVAGVFTFVGAVARASW